MIDWAQVKTLRDDLGHEAFGEVVDLFFVENDPVVQRLDHHTAPHQMQADFHFLKGTATYLGFDDFAQLCTRCEERALAGSLSAKDIGQAVACYAGSKAEFSAKLPGITL